MDYKGDVFMNKPITKEEIYKCYVSNINTELVFGEINFEIDTRSQELNEALYKLFFLNSENNEELGLKSIELKVGNDEKGPYYSFFLNGYDFILSTDYIGPSVWWCEHIAGYTHDKIREIIKQSRTLGGHLMWPRGTDKNGNRRTPSVNQVRGGQVSKGCGCGFYDRIDWTLFLLKIFYQCKNEDYQCKNEEQYNRKIEDFFPDTIFENDKKCFKALYDAFYRSSDWFGVFKSFNVFCDFFKLTDSLVDKDYNIIWFTDCFPIKPDKDKYMKYTENNLKAIKNRNRNLEKWICSHERTGLLTLK